VNGPNPASGVTVANAIGSHVKIETHKRKQNNRMTSEKLIRLVEWVRNKREVLESERWTRDKVVTNAAIQLGFGVTKANVVSVYNVLGISYHGFNPERRAVGNRNGNLKHLLKGGPKKTDIVAGIESLWKGVDVLLEKVGVLVDKKEVDIDALRREMAEKVVILKKSIQPVNTEQPQK
jgi:hypothetical protein